jgi:hypothetical protein
MRSASILLLAALLLARLIDGLRLSDDAFASSRRLCSSLDHSSFSLSPLFCALLSQSDFSGQTLNAKMLSDMEETSDKK